MMAEQFGTCQIVSKRVKLNCIYVVGLFPVILKDTVNMCCKVPVDIVLLNKPL